MKKPGILVVLILCLSISSVSAQRIFVEKEALYTSKVNVPVKVEVVSKHMSHEFYAQNKSYFPYTVHLEVSEIVNLIPPSVNKVYKVNPGRTKLVELKPQDLSRSTDYYFEYSYAIGVKGGKLDLEYPYLIPVKAGFGTLVDEENNKLLPDHFMMSKGDTVYAARKGKVVATPDLFDGTDRISQNKSVEILHGDATMMVYENIDPAFVPIKAGKAVYPGQAIGVLNSDAHLNLVLYKSTGDGYLEVMDIHYLLDEQTIEPFSERMKDVPVIHPMSIVTKEFKRRELKNLEKGVLVL